MNQLEEVIRPGMILDYPGATIPDGWLLCYGQAISRATYEDLFTAIGTQFGAGDGSTTFNVPDLRGRVTVGRDDMGGSAAGRVNSSYITNPTTRGGSGGAQSHTLTEAQLPSHTHSYSYCAAAWGGSGVANGAGYAGATRTTAGATNAGGAAHNNTAPTIISNKIIKL